MGTISDLSCAGSALLTAIFAKSAVNSASGLVVNDSNDMEWSAQVIPNKYESFQR